MRVRGRHAPIEHLAVRGGGVGRAEPSARAANGILFRRADGSYVDPARGKSRERAMLAAARVVRQHRCVDFQTDRRPRPSPLAKRGADLARAKRLGRDIDAIARVADRRRLQGEARVLMQCQVAGRQLRSGDRARDRSHGGRFVRLDGRIAPAHGPISVVEIATTIDDGRFEVHRGAERIPEPDRNAMGAEGVRTGEVRIRTLR